jgi:PKD repeat protein
MKKFNSILVLAIALLTSGWVNAQCTGTISASGSGAAFTFTSTNPTSAAQSHSWDFGDGMYGYGQTTTHTYAATGAYTVIAYFGDSLNLCGDIDTIVIQAVVTGGTTCSAAFNTTGTDPTFTFTPTGTPTAPPGYFSYSWDFGDGATNWSSLAPSHTYTANGTYNVQCILYDSIWCSDTVINTIVVTGVASTTCDGTFTSFDSNGTVIFVPSFPMAGATYAWSFGDGTSSTAQNPVHTYTASGAYTACLTISGPNGVCTDTFCDSILVTVGTGVTCDAAFTTTNSGANYQFTPNFPDPTATYSWSFGDGNSSTSANPSHTYTASGTYTVSCARVIPNACVDSSFTTVTINISNPTNGIISGVVNMGNTYADQGVVFLITYDSNSILSAVDTTVIDSMGMYYFANVAYGTYLVKAALSPVSTDYANYLPSYHATSTSGALVGELLWAFATDVVLSTPYLNNIDIELVAGTNTGGPGFIGGLVSQGANKEGDPISDILILITDASGNPIAYEYSDNTGAFNVTGLAYGTYVVYPEVPGKTTTPITVVLSATQTGTDKIRVAVNTNTVDASIATGIAELPQFANISIYPNPVIDYLKIDLGNGLSGNVSVRVMDITGKVISLETVNSTGVVQINTSKFNTGIYLLSIENKGDTAIYRFIK